ncbi:lycopene cyclase family protein, partial [Commensalibacter sp. A3DC]
MVIIGGGLAGLTLASQLLRDIPDISICLIHDA